MCAKKSSSASASAQAFVSGPTFQAFAISIGRGAELRKARKAVKETLGKGWTVRHYGDNPGNFEVINKRPKLSVQAAWEKTYRLRAQPDVLNAEPIFSVWITDRPDWSDTPTQAAGEAVAAFGIGDAIMSFLCGDGPDLSASNDNLWSLEKTRVIEAWQRFFPGANSKPGEGIVIGHPDTGYRRHPEIRDSLLAERGFDFMNNDADPEDELSSGPLFTPGHGTGTASVIVSPRGSASSGQDAVTGTAPGAKLIPFRVGPTVIIFDPLNLARAIERAADEGAHVISISMGGVVVGERLLNAVTYAQRRGVIILAAAGNCVRFVIWPAAYDQVIAVAASNARGEIWRGSSRGGAVDVTAPGEFVWRATATRNNGADVFEVSRGSGTSYAVATVAGIAALWLARHGRETLINRYGLEKIPFVFNQLLRSTCVPVPEWEPGQFGAGLVNAEQLLAAELPDGVEQPTFAVASFLEGPSPLDRGGLPTFTHLFNQSLRATSSDPGDSGILAAQAVDPQARLRAALAGLLGTTEEELPTRLNEVGQELAFHLATNPELYKQFEASLSGQGQPSAMGESPMAAATAEAVENVVTVRERLLANDLSRALRTRLESG